MLLPLSNSKSKSQFLLTIEPIEILQVLDSHKMISPVSRIQLMQAGKLSTPGMEKT